MERDPIILRMNIAHYLAMLRLNLDDEERSLLTRLLAGAREDLLRATNSNHAEQQRDVKVQAARPALRNQACAGR